MGQKHCLLSKHSSLEKLFQKRFAGSMTNIESPIVIVTAQLMYNFFAIYNFQPRSPDVRLCVCVFMHGAVNFKMDFATVWLRLSFSFASCTFTCYVSIALDLIRWTRVSRLIFNTLQHPPHVHNIALRTRVVFPFKNHENKS